MTGRVLIARAEKSENQESESEWREAGEWQASRR
jgi:hypothetical protein